MGAGAGGARQAQLSREPYWEQKLRGTCKNTERSAREFITHIREQQSTEVPRIEGISLLKDA